MSAKRKKLTMRFLEENAAVIGVGLERKNYSLPVSRKTAAEFRRIKKR